MGIQRDRRCGWLLANESSRSSVTGSGAVSFRGASSRSSARQILSTCRERTRGRVGTSSGTRSTKRTGFEGLDRRTARSLNAFASPASRWSASWTRRSFTLGFRGGSRTCWSSKGLRDCRARLCYALRMRRSWILMVVVGCGGTPFTVGVDVVPLESETATMVDAGGSEILAPESGAMDAATDTKAQASDVGSSDAEMATDLGSTCLQAPSTPCGCAGGPFTYPQQFCLFPSTFAVILPTPTACQCAGHYTCECVSAMNPCAVTGQVFVDCV